MSRVAGLEITKDRVRLAVLEGSAKSYALEDYLDEELTGESEVERQESLGRILGEWLAADKRNRNTDIIASIDSKRTTLREISVPFAKDEQIVKTIRFEAESYIHSQAIEDIIVEYLKCSESENSSRLLICAAPKKVIGGYLEELREHKIDPISIELEVTALATAFSTSPLYSPEQTTLLVQLDRSATRMVLIQNGRVVKIRSIWSHFDPGSNGAAALPAESSLAEAATSGSSQEESSNGASSSGESSNGGTAEDPPEKVGESTDFGVERVESDTSVFAADPDELQDEITKRFEAIERSLESLDSDDSGDEEIPFVVLSEDDYNSLRGSDGERVEGGSAGSGSESRPAPQESSPSTSLAVTKRSKDEEEKPASAAATALAEYAPLSSTDKLILEIERTFASYFLAEGIDLMVLTGAASGSSDLNARLKDHFEVDVTNFDFGDSLELEWKEGELKTLNREGAVACGLALRGLDLGLADFDLRKEEFRYERRFARLMPALTLTGLLLCATSLLWCFERENQFQLLKNESDRLTARQGEMVKNKFGKKLSPSPDYFLAAKKRLEDMSGTGGGRSRNRSSGIEEFAHPNNMLLEVISAIRTAGDTPEPAVYPKYEQFDLNCVKKKSSKSTIKFWVESFDDFTTVSKALKDLENFDCTISNDVNRSGGYDVTAQLTFKEELLPKKRKR